MEQGDEDAEPMVLGLHAQLSITASSAKLDGKQLWASLQQSAIICARNVCVLGGRVLIYQNSVHYYQMSPSKLPS